MRSINELIAKRLTLMISTMWCAYAFALMVMVPLVLPQTGAMIMYISSSFLQLVFLPLIMVGQNVLSRESEARAEADHRTLLQELEELKAIHQLLTKTGT